MKRLYPILAFFFLLLPLTAIAQNETEKSEWEPVAEWPFMYQNFADAKISLNTMQVVKAKANIHVGNRYVWYESKGKRLEVKKGIVTKVTFDNGDTYYPIGDRLCQIICEDTVNGKLSRLYMSHELDRDAFNERARINNQSTMLTEIPGVLSNIANDLADREGGSRIDQEALPMKDKFFILYNDDIFEATEGNILKHLSKQERSVYLSYTRKAEVLSYSRKSMENVWNTFFNK